MLTKQLIAILILSFLIFSFNISAGTLEDIQKKLGAKSNNESDKYQSIKTKGFMQLAGRYCIVEVRDISAEEAEQILKHMNRLIEEFLKLYEYPFGTQKCYITVYGLKKDYDRIARKEDVETAEAFSYREGLNHYAVTYYSADMYPTLSHEAFHLFIENIFKRGIPIWFNEGMASYYETCSFSGERFMTNRVNKNRLAVAKGSLHGKEWPGIKDLIRFSWNQFHGKNEAVNYAASWALVYFLKNKNEEAFKDFVHDLILGKSFATAVRQNYSMDQKELETEWVNYIDGLQ